MGAVVLKMEMGVYNPGTAFNSKGVRRNLVKRGHFRFIDRCRATLDSLIDYINEHSLDPPRKITTPVIKRDLVKRSVHLTIVRISSLVRVAEDVVARAVSCVAPVGKEK